MLRKSYADTIVIKAVGYVAEISYKNNQLADRLRTILNN